MFRYILAFWRNQEARGLLARPVWAIVHRDGSTQPEGYCQGWSVSKRAAARDAEKVGGRIRLVRVCP